MFNPLTKAQLSQIETDLIEIAKGALPPTKAEWKRYDKLRDRDEYAQMSLPAGILPPQWQELYGLTEAERAELDALSAKAERLAMMPEESAAEEQLFAKYGPTTGTAVPRRAITTQQSITEKELAAAFYGHGRGIEQPFKERAGGTISLEEYERPRGRNPDRGVGDEFEKAQEMGGAQTTGPGDGFRKGKERDDGKLPVLDVFPAYISMAPWVIWDAIREFDGAKRKPNNPNPLGAVIWTIAIRRARHELDRLPHGTKRSRDIKHDHGHDQRMLDIMEKEFSDAMAKADTAVGLFLNESKNPVDAAVLQLWWPLPDRFGDRPKATPAAEIARRFRCHRSVIGRRLDRIRNQINDLDHALTIWEALDSYSQGKISWSELATNPKLAGIINRSVIVAPLVRPERRSTGVYYEAPYDPYHRCKRPVRLKNGRYVNLICQRAGRSVSLM